MIKIDCSKHSSKMFIKYGKYMKFPVLSSVLISRIEQFEYDFDLTQDLSTLLNKSLNKCLDDLSLSTHEKIDLDLLSLGSKFYDSPQWKLGLYGFKVSTPNLHKILWAWSHIQNLKLFKCRIIISSDWAELGIDLAFFSFK